MIANLKPYPSMKDPEAPDFGLLAHVSPIQWDNVTLYGAYDLRRDLVQPQVPR